MCAHPRNRGNDEQLPFLQHDDKYKHWAENVGSTEDTNEKKTYGTIKMDKKNQEDKNNVNNTTTKMAAGEKQEVPDGGWGWLVVLGVSMSNMTTQALVSVFGFLFSQRLTELNIATSGAAVIFSVQSAVLNLSGLFTGALIRRFSYQKVALTGALLMMAGLLLTTLADSLVSYVLTYGVFTGLGLGFLYPSTFVAVNSYFSSKKGIAVGWSLTGTGVGQMLLPILVSFLLEEYGFRGTILILAAISGHSFVGALLYQPVAWHLKKKGGESSIKKPPLETPTIQVVDEKQSQVKNKIEGPANNDEKGIRSLAIRRLSEPRCRSSASIHSIELDQDDNEISPTRNGSKNVPGGLYSNSDSKSSTDNAPKKENTCKKILTMLDYDLLKNGPFLIVIIGAGVIFTANSSFQMLFPLFLESLQYSRKEIATCMVALSAFDIIGRPILPYIMRFFKVRAKTIFFSSALLSAFARSALASQNTMIPMLILSATCGLFRSAIITNMNLSVAEQTTAVKLPAALGLQMVSKGLCALALGPLIGVIRDSTRSYTLCIHILSVLFLVLPFLAYLTERLFCTRKLS